MYALQQHSVSPYFTNGKKKSEVKKMRGKSIMLSCPASGSPKPAIKWFRNGHEIRQNNHNFQLLSNGAALKVFNVKTSATGKYKCVAENVVGSVCRYFYLKHLGWFLINYYKNNLILNIQI